jgi:Fe2+ transport system protein FeoA
MIRTARFVAIRLESLGFVPGTQVEVITKGIFGGDPILNPNWFYSFRFT